MLSFTEKILCSNVIDSKAFNFCFFCNKKWGLGTPIFFNSNNNEFIEDEDANDFTEEELKALVIESWDDIPSDEPPSDTVDGWGDTSDEPESDTVFDW